MSLFVKSLLIVEGETYWKFSEECKKNDKNERIFELLIKNKGN